MKAMRLMLSRRAGIWPFLALAVLIGSAAIHTAAWTETFDEFISRRVERTGARFAPFNPRVDYPRHIHGKPRLKDGLVIFPVYHPAAALRQPALRDALFADFAALALYLARPPAPKPEAEEAKRPAEQITLFG